MHLGVALTGLILVFCAMDLQSIVFAPANELPDALFLPGFANVSPYHGLLQEPLAAAPEAARDVAAAYVQEGHVAALRAGVRRQCRQASRTSATGCEPKSARAK